MASYSSSSTRCWKFDVFLSFRGLDTRKGIAVELHDRLNRSGIKTFMNNPDLQVGDTISPTLIKAIQDSRFAIVVLSQNYASSTWCLEELGEICRSMEDNRILPLFYEVDPTDVRHQKRNFEEAFSKHEKSGRYESENVKQWRADLHRVANISGWNTDDHNTHRDLIDDIVEYLRRKVPLDVIESTEDFQEYEATTQAMDKVKKALANDEITAIGVYGMGGVGKTSLVKHVAAQACKNGTFNHWIIAAISQSLDLKRVQGILADFLSVKFDEETEDGRAARLRKEIKRREKLLIIVDDVWKRINLLSIGIPSYEELQKCESKVLVTTRSLKVCNDMICHEKIALNILSEKDSWTLFLRNAGTTPLQSTTFETVARRVAAECKGLPIALVVVARALRDEDMDEWEKAAVRLKNAQHANPNHEEDEENAFRCIRLSYDYLKNEDHKSFFLLCCLFPEDHDIRLEDLFKYAFGIGLFGVAETTIEEARGAAVSVVKYLKGSSLLLDSEDKGCVKMHDVVRDTALNIAQSEDGLRFYVKAGCGLKEWPPRGLPKGCTAISVMNNGIQKLPEEELVCPNLQILLLNVNSDLDEIPEKFMKNLSFLSVLDLSDTKISVLPQSFSLLINLQALYLDYCKQLIDISKVGSLKKLEILSMRKYSLRELSREIGHLTNLRILDVSSDRELIIPSKMMSKLHKLQELYIMNCACGEVWGIKELSFAGLSSLKILRVCLSDTNCIPKNVEVEPDWEYFYIFIGNLPRYSHNQHDYKSKSLVLQTTMNTLPDWFINTVTKKTERLEYYCFQGMSDMVMVYDHGRFHKLKYLTVHSYSNHSSFYLKELMNTIGRVQTGPVFENLEKLHLENLMYLEELCVGELPPGSLFNLKVFTVFQCERLKYVSKFVQKLPNLEKLDLTFMDELEYVFRCEGLEPKQPKLREMHLVYLKALKSICNGPAPPAMFQSLKILTIYRCKLLQSLFTSDVAQCLVQLEDLLVEGCPRLERVMEVVNNEKTVLPKLKNLVLKNLPMLYGPSATTVDIECPSLEHLIVVDCTHISFSTSSDHFKSSESRNRFSTSASKYFGSKNTVQFNDLQQYEILRGRFASLERTFISVLEGFDRRRYTRPLAIIAQQLSRLRLRMKPI